MGCTMWLDRHERSQEISLLKLSLGITSGTIPRQTFPKFFSSSKALDDCLIFRFNLEVEIFSII